MNNSTYDYFVEGELKMLAQAKNSFSDTWVKTIAFFNSYQFKEIIFTLKTISVIISLIFLVLIVILLIKINIKAKVRSSISRFRPVVFNKKKMAKKWDKIEKKLNTSIETNYKLAVLEADKIFNNILKDIGYEAEIKITNQEELKEARKIKNNIVEDSDFKLDINETRKTIVAYKKGLEDLKIL